MEAFLQQLVNGIAWGGIYALIALGYTMVYGVLKLINFAHGEVYMMGAMSGYYSARWLGLSQRPGAVSLLAALGIAMAFCAALGTAIERVAYRPLRRASRLAPLITAIGVSLFFQNAGQLVFGADPKVAPRLLETRELLRFGEVAITNLQLVILGVASGLCVALTFVVQRTRVGKAMRAVAFDRETAALMGVPIDRVIAFTFALGSALAAAAGILVSLSNPKVDPLMGLMPGLKAFVAAVLGGIGSLPGAMLGGVLMGIAETLVAGYLSSTYRDAIAFVILIVILVLRPAGLLGHAAKEKV